MCGHGTLRWAGRVAGFAFLECARCLFTFSPDVSAAEMAKRYASGYHGASDGAPATGWANASFLRPALELLPRGPLTILDVGCGESLIPDLLRGAGHRVIGIDVASPARAHPDRLTGDVASTPLAPASVDLAYAFQVFEHLPEPAATLRAMLRVVRPGGLALVHTDMEVPERTSLESWWYVTPPDHCSFYRHRTFEVALERSGHRIEWRDAKCVIIRVGAVDAR